MTEKESARALMDGVAAFLQANGIGTAGTSLWVGEAPAEEDEGLVLYETGSWRKPDPGSRSLYPSFQAVVLSYTYAAGHTKAYDVFGLLDGKRSTVLPGGAVVAIIHGVGLPFALPGRDSAGRRRFVCNYAGTI